MNPDYAIAGSKQRALRRAAGRRCRSVMLSQHIETGRETVTEFVQCVHCGRHWQFVKGSGKQRGFCLRCNGFTCGPGCIAGENCVPQGQFLRNLEAGMPAAQAARHRPIMAAVEAEPPRSTGGVILGSA